MAESPYINAPGILDVPEYVGKTVVIDYGLAETVKAGTPIGEDGAAHNDGEAIGILLFDVHKEIGMEVGTVVIAGRVKADVAAAHSGVTVSAEAKAAMKNVAFTGDEGPVPMPAVTDEDAGKLLGVDEDGKVVPVERYDVTVEDAGKLLGVDEDGKVVPVVRYDVIPADGLLLASSTEESEKVFRITVDDDGVLTATEVVEDAGGDAGGDA